MSNCCFFIERKVSSLYEKILVNIRGREDEVDYYKEYDGMENKKMVT
jgi:hypothetical protein